MVSSATVIAAMGSILAQQNTVLPVGAPWENFWNTELFYCLTVIKSLNKEVCQFVNAQHELSKLENYNKKRRIRKQYTMWKWEILKSTI